MYETDEALLQSLKQASWYDSSHDVNCDYIIKYLPLSQKELVILISEYSTLFENH